jgi:hypothetical protein
MDNIKVKVQLFMYVCIVVGLKTINTTNENSLARLLLSLEVAQQNFHCSFKYP